jgi:4-hydroxyphenylpyruvate dioxygenase
MALRVDDATAALKRAGALLSPAWQERVGPGERRIPAVRAPDGTLIHLVAPDASGRSIYDDDFVLFPESTPAEGPLTGIDHVAQAVPFGRMDAFILFWRAVFGLEPEQLFELPDPYGLVRSRTMVSKDRTLRFPLNSSESRQTATGRFLTMFGAGVHHIALATSDMAAAIERVRLLGGRLLPVPENYYDDLGARFGLDDAFLAQLRRDNLLFDRDDAGAYLQAYTASFDDRFFFEIVQRTGDYQQYGAANAAVRLAAQAQTYS